MGNSAMYLNSGENIIPNTPYKRTAPMPASADKQTDIPFLSECRNVLSNLSAAMSGSVMQLEGTNLVFDKQDIQQGLFLIDLAGNAVKVVTIVRMKADKIIFMIPGGLRAGMYKLELRKRQFQSDLMLTSSLQAPLQLIV